jgi:hypothetical protein
LPSENVIATPSRNSSALTTRGEYGPLILTTDARTTP